MYAIKIGYTVYPPSLCAHKGLQGEIPRYKTFRSSGTNCTNKKQWRCFGV